jgi:TolA-binding protein
MEKLSNVLVPDDVIEQSRIINSTTLKIENLEAQISRMRKDIDLLNITLLANQKYDALSNLPLDHLS